MVTNFVAHLDILGFGNVVLRDFDEAWGVLSDFQQSAADMLKTKLPKSNICVSENVRMKFFSDCIILYTSGDSDLNLWAILYATSQLFANAFCTRVPLRGGIAHGKFVMNDDKEMFMGESLVKAHHIGERAQWLGLVVDHSTRDKSKNVVKDFVLKWRLCNKDGTEEEYNVLNWPKVYGQNFTKNPVTGYDCYGAFEQMFGPYELLNRKDKAKYENTAEFINANLPKDFKPNSETQSC